MKFKHIVLGAALLIASGCTALQPFPNVARSGDTVALAIGSPDDMSRANTTATFTSDVDGVPIDITSNIRSIFKLFADPASRIYNPNNITATLVESSKHTPWITIAVIDLPLGLQVGAGNIEFNTSAVYPDIGSHINDLQLPIEIIAGTGSSNSFDYELGKGASVSGSLTQLEPQARAVFGPTIPSAACPCPTYAAIEVKVAIPTLEGTIPAEVRVIPDDLTMLTQSSRNMLHGVSSDGQELTVSFLSPTGSLEYYEAQFSVVQKMTGTPTINSIKYFDLNGNEVTGPVSDYTVVLR
ncbi:MAG: hypothetical protein OEY89_02740 [Gammaproteobacteria bacterium]|nr:hypothetical protein [Gammaproteobacteria bacterium]